MDEHIGTRRLSERDFGIHWAGGQARVGEVNAQVGPLVQRLIEQPIRQLIKPRSAL